MMGTSACFAQRFDGWTQTRNIKPFDSLGTFCRCFRKGFGRFLLDTPACVPVGIHHLFCSCGPLWTKPQAWAAHGSHQSVRQENHWIGLAQLACCHCITGSVSKPLCWTTSISASSTKYNLGTRIPFFADGFSKWTTWTTEPLTVPVIVSVQNGSYGFPHFEGNNPNHVMSGDKWFQWKFNLIQMTPNSVTPRFCRYPFPFPHSVLQLRINCAVCFCNRSLLVMHIVSETTIRASSQCVW